MFWSRTANLEIQSTKKQATNKAEGTKPTNLPMLSRKRVGLEKTSIHNLTLRSLARMSKIAKYKREIFSRSIFFWVNFEIFFHAK